MLQHYLPRIVARSQVRRDHGNHLLNLTPYALKITEGDRAVMGYLVPNIAGDRCQGEPMAFGTKPCPMSQQCLEMAPLACQWAEPHGRVFFRRFWQVSSYRPLGSMHACEVITEGEPYLINAGQE